MRIINAFVGIKKRINDILGWSYGDGEGLGEFSIQGSVLENMKRYGHGISGMNTDGCVLGNTSGNPIASFADNTLTINSGTTMVTNTGRIIEIGNNVVQPAITADKDIYYRYTEVTDTNSTSVDIQNSSNRHIANDEISHIATVLSGQVAYEMPVDLEYVYVGKVVYASGEVIINYPAPRSGYLGSFNNQQSVSYVSGVTIAKGSAAGTVVLNLTKRKLTVVDGLIKSDTVDTDTTPAQQQIVISIPPYTTPAEGATSAPVVKVV